MVKCIYCKNEIPPGADGCPYCLDVPTISKSKSKAGEIALGILGGIFSLFVGSMILVVFPRFHILGPLLITIIQDLTLLGGIITIIGTLLFLQAETSKNIKIAWITVLIGALVGGGSVISIYAALRIKKYEP